MGSGSASRVLVIGGGVGGLAAAVRLAARGARVTVLEKNARSGGKLNRWRVPHPGRPNETPFSFDTGPSLLTLPFVFDDLLAVAGLNRDDVLPTVRLDPIARFDWADGSHFSLRASVDDQLAEVARFTSSAADVDGWRRFFERGHDIWNVGGELFLFHAPEQVMARKGGSALDGLRTLAVPFRIGMFQKYRVLVDRHVRHPRLREVLYQYATYSGASPFKAPATLGVIPFAESHFGGWYPKGGMYRIAEVLEAAARKLGVEVRTGEAVARIEIESVGGGQWAVGGEDRHEPAAHGRQRAHSPAVRGVTLSTGERLAADAVVCNADVIWAYRNLIDARFRPHFTDAKLNTIEPGGSGMVLLLGVEGTYPQLAHHTKFMPEDYKSDLRAMFDTLTVPRDPCIYVCATTRTDPTQAPDGCENLFVLCSAPPLTAKLDWDNGTGQRYRDQIVHTLEHRFGLTDLSKRIVVESRYTPRRLADDYNANFGSIYGVSSNSLRTAFLRPPNRDPKIRGLFFAGGATHPGGGLPLVALSGKIVSELCGDSLGLPPLATSPGPG
jgi:phytoene desaturase